MGPPPRAYSSGTRGSVFLPSQEQFLLGFSCGLSYVPEESSCELVTGGTGASKISLTL